MSDKKISNVKILPSLEKNINKTNTSGRKIVEDTSLALNEMYQRYFLDYASYVILDRAIPRIEDGLKPVQRRILFSLKEMDDGRYNKVANIVGHAMRYHPHGDASIKEAMVSIGQKKILIDPQGNWGNILTGDDAAAPRYIEARLTKFSHSILFNKDLTQWQPSYDSRGYEPTILPVKFPILLAQGTEGIAVGLSTKILPHNIVELIEASIADLKGKHIKLLPDFLTGGQIDVADYNDGEKGGKVKVRAKIDTLDSKTLRITEIPFGTTTTSLIESIVSASEKGKIKIKKVEDNTAKNVEIMIYLHPGDDTEKTINALYAFTRCEESISPVACVISEEKPLFTNVSTLLKYSVERTKELLKQELQIKENELKERLLFCSLEKIFIEEKIYRSIEACESWESVIETIGNKFDPFKKDFYREITDEDIASLTEIKIKRISKFDKKKADEIINKAKEELTLTQFRLANLIEYACDFYKSLLKEFGPEWKRRTEIKSFSSLNKVDLAKANLKVFVNAKEGFIGTSLKKEEFLADCSDMDEIICFMKDGTFKVTKVADKTFVGKNIIHSAIYRRGDEDTVYSLIYSDGKDGIPMVKRFVCPAITRDKLYDLTKGNKGSQVLFFNATKNGEKEVEVLVVHKPAPRIKKEFKFDLNEISVKGRDSQGNILSRHQVQKVSKS